MNYISSFRKIMYHPCNEGKTLQTVLRLCWWKINQLFFHLPVVYQLTSSTKIICWPDSSYGSYIVYARYPEYEEMEFIHMFLKKNDIMLDVGANIGAVSLVAADKITKGKIYAFEPTTSILEKLAENVRLNQLESIITIQRQAVSNGDGTIKFLIKKESEVNSIVSKTVSKSDKSISVPTITIDSFLSQKKIKRVQLLKVDVEGAELMVFQGAEKSLKRQIIDVIVFEVNQKANRYGYSSSQLFEMLDELKYSLYSFTANGRLVPYNISHRQSDTINLVAVAKSIAVKNRLTSLIEVSSSVG